MHEPAERSEPHDDTAAAEMAEVRRRMRTYGEQRQRKERSGAAKWLLLLALVYLVLGAGLAPMRADQAAAALHAVADKPDDELLTLDGGGRMSVAEYRVFVANATARALATSLGLAAAFVALFFWARRNPVPALLAAIALWVAVNVVETILEPGALQRGFVVKVLCFAILVLAIRSALQQSRASPEAFSGA